MYEPKGVTISYDAPVPMGTTDFSQFIQGAEEADVTGAMLALGEQEAVQVVRAGQQLATDLALGLSLGSFSRATVADFGDIADQMVFVWAFPPATADVPVYAAIRDDLAASGVPELQPEELKASAMRSWIGLYALLRMLRDDGMTEFSREAIKTVLDTAEDVPMLGIFDGEDWTPDVDHPGAFQRAGVNHWATFRWDPEAGENGDFVQASTMSFDEVLCGTPFGAPADTC
jgi:ABC-type branched-subunit amino acid transport system substrate-binding protein